MPLQETNRSLSSDVHRSPALGPGPGRQEPSLPTTLNGRDGLLSSFFYVDDSANPMHTGFSCNFPMTFCVISPYLTLLSHSLSTTHPVLFLVQLSSRPVLAGGNQQLLGAYNEIAKFEEARDRDGGATVGVRPQRFAQSVWGGVWALPGEERVGDREGKIGRWWCWLGQSC